ncbi:MAG TPA: TetR/AcrR family transcriptional regulator [Streptosporangiaceae bacterium]|nr:TetR/AcrR family transcriptional regulator [Streptosporangiaceae bacterium]
MPLIIWTGRVFIITHEYAEREGQHPESLGVTDGLTIDAIAAEAGAGRQTIYRWWPSKGAVAADALARHARVVVPGRDTGSFTGDLAAFLGDSFAGLPGKPTPWRAAMWRISVARRSGCSLVVRWRRGGGGARTRPRKPPHGWVALWSCGSLPGSRAGLAAASIGAPLAGRHRPAGRCWRCPVRRRWAGGDPVYWLARVVASAV